MCVRVVVDENEILKQKPYIPSLKAGGLRPKGQIINPIPWPDPSPDDLSSPEFEAIWQTIKTWDINVPEAYVGYCGASGNHAKAILDALRQITEQD